MWLRRFLSQTARMRFLLLCVIGLGGCASPRHVEFGQEFALSQGQRVWLADSELQVIFEKVTEDSRCPMNARCIQEGNARIALIVRNEARNSRGEIFETLDQDVTLDTNASLHPRAIFFGDMLMELRRLDPTPMAGVPVRKYTAVLYAEMSKAAAGSGT